MTETVNLPQIGKVDKKWVVAGVAITGGIVGYAYWKRRQNSGVTYLSDSTTGGTGDDSAYAPPVGGRQQEVDVPNTAISSNSKWTEEVIAALGNIGLDSGYVSSTLGKYLNSQKLTNDEANVVRQAWALKGRPPESPNLTIMLLNESGSNGEQSTNGQPPGIPANIRQSGMTPSSITVSWDPVPGALDYEYYEESDFGGSIPRKTTSTTVTWGGLIHGVEHTFYVKARNSYGSSPPAIVHAWTDHL